MTKLCPSLRARVTRVVTLLARQCVKHCILLDFDIVRRCDTSHAVCHMLQVVDRSMELIATIEGKSSVCSKILRHASCREDGG